jgi:polyisoprenoid-binding protein YceI
MRIPLRGAAILARSLAALALVFAAAGLFAETFGIDAEHSTITVHVGKSGVFSAFADTHTIRAPIASGRAENGPEKRVELTLDARRMTVLDPDLSADKRREVQTRTLGPEVLDVERFPEIRFRSEKVEALGEGRWRITGALELHGKSAPVTFEVTESGGHVRGTARLSQRAFGIEPISIAGGTVKVKDEVSVELDIALSGAGNERPRAR